MTLQPNASITVYLVRLNGALLEIFTDFEQAETYMKSKRRNGQFWTIKPMQTVPHQAKP